MSQDDDLYIVGRGPGHPVKVGRSNDVKRRLSRLQTASPERLRVLGLHKGMGPRETAVHGMLPGRKSGEWFAWSPEVALWCNRLSAEEIAEASNVNPAARIECSDRVHFTVCNGDYERIHLGTSFEDGYGIDVNRITEEGCYPCAWLPLPSARAAATRLLEEPRWDEYGLRIDALIRWRPGPMPGPVRSVLLWELDDHWQFQWTSEIAFSLSPFEAREMGLWLQRRVWELETLDKRTSPPARGER